jgi:hypothetical protein
VKVILDHFKNYNEYFSPPKLQYVATADSICLFIIDKEVGLNEP